MPIDIKDANIDSKKMQEAIRILSAGLDECAGNKINAESVFMALNIVGMMVVEAGFEKGEKAEKFQLIKKIAQRYYIAIVSKNPNLWSKKV